MSYLEEIKKRGRSANPFFVLMGIDVVSFGDGESRLEMDVRPDMMNGAGFLQGGIFTALADESMALALFTVLDDGARIATISENTTYLRGVKEGRITARGRVSKTGRHFAFVEGWVEKDEEMLSKTSASFAII